MQKEQITGAKRVQHRQIHPFTATPEQFNQRAGIQFAIKREKQRDGMRHHYGRISHHAGCGLLGEKGLLLKGEFTPTLANGFANLLS